MYFDVVCILDLFFEIFGNFVCVGDFGVCLYM